MGGHERHVAGHAIVEQVEVLADRAPANTLGRHTIHRGEVVQQLFQFLGRGGGVGQAVHAHELGGHALPQLDLVLRIGEQDKVGMGVHVDEARADDTAANVDHPPGLDVGIPRTHDGDGVARDAHAATEPGLASAVYDSSVSQKRVKHGGPPKCVAGTCGR